MSYEKELIEIATKQTVSKIVNILENFKANHFRDYSGVVQDAIHLIIDAEIERAVGNLADSIAYEFKVGNYRGEDNKD